MTYKINFFKNYLAKFLTELINLTPATLCLIGLIFFIHGLSNSLLLVLLGGAAIIEPFFTYFNFYSNARIEIKEESFILTKKGEQVIKFQDIVAVEYDTISYQKRIPHSIELYLITSEKTIKLDVHNILQDNRIIRAQTVVNEILTAIDKSHHLSKLMPATSVDIFKKARIN